jgi:AraC family transcriptional regulator, transcriptional activator of the genes for pyochelin and ferripyochelin receptors
MGLRIISPDGQTLEVLPFTKQKGNTVWCWCNIQTHQHNMVYGKRPGFKKSVSDPHFIIEFSPAVFQTIALTGNEVLQLFARKIKKGKAQLFASQHLHLDAAMHQCIYSITHYQGNDDGKKMYMYARILDLLWLQQQNYMRAQTPQPVYVKTEYDKERILYARDYLLTHMDAPPTLPQLAAIAGINEFKLKRGFKEMFNHTVFGYLADVRLEMARTALQKKQKTVTQIAFELGYASLQHFSAAFKKKFGVAPGRY